MEHDDFDSDFEQSDLKTFFKFSFLYGRRNFSPMSHENEIEMT